MRRCLQAAYAQGVRRCLALVLAVCASGAYAADAIDQDAAAKAATDATTRRQAATAIPLNRVAPEHRDDVAAIIADPTIFRRLPTSVVDCRPEMFTYLAENPETLVEIWRELGLSRARLTRTGPTTFQLQDGAGTTADVVVVESTCDAAAQNRIVMLVDGQYNGKPFNTPLTARCVLALISGSVEETNGREYVATRIDAFVKLDQAGVALLAKAMHPLVGKTADRNFADTVNFVSSLSYTSEVRPDRIHELALLLRRVEMPRRQRFDEVIDDCHRQGQEWLRTHVAADAEPELRR